MIDPAENRQGRRNKRPGPKASLPALIVACILLLSHSAQAVGQSPDSTASPRSAGGIKAKGYLSARYAYVGSSSAATVYSGMRLTGSFQLSALSDRIVFKYRSHHWLNFARPEKHVLESAFANRNIIHTGYVETDGLLARALSVRLGRFIPEMDYSSSPVIDGAALAYERRGFIIGGAAGMPVDLWDGKEMSNDLLAAAHLKYRTDRVRLSAGYQSSSHFDLKQREAPTGFNVMLTKFIWLETYAAYDFEFRETTRAGAGLSWRDDRGSLSVAVSQWRNPFDQLYLLDRSLSLVYSGPRSGNAPSIYRDVRLSGSVALRGWGVRGALATMAGIRSGWMTNIYLLTPSFYGFRANVGAQSMKSDFLKFYSLDAMVMTQVREFSLQAQIQARSYEWLPRPSGFYNRDSYSEISAEYPLRRHLYLSAAAGGFFRNLGDEGFKPQAELRLIARI
ncbi:MAG: hypothetical protein NTW97_03985 [Candidatus Krumholzibacteria bacterium]|nr:hypothetical protein [Candidatus Krumholzibacteria bacterium]